MHEEENKMCKGEINRGLRRVNPRQKKRRRKTKRLKKEKTLQIVLRARKCKREKIKCVKGERKDYRSKYKFRVPRRKRQRLRERNKRCR